MNVKLKLAAYVVLIILTAWFGHSFYANYQSGAGPAASIVTPTKKKATNAPAVTAALNNAPIDTNVVATTTNPNDQATNSSDANVTSNGVAQTPVADTNQPAAAPSNSTAAADQDPTTLSQTITGGHQGKTIVYLALFVISVVGLGLLVAIDVTHLIGSKAGDYLFSDVGDGERDPEYDKAEQIWANGKHLEAIQMLRDYYKRNPRQVHAALRIAEIYEKDLKNYLAAALEYEEVLKKKLPDDRWGWAAIHLCNLYSRLGQQEKTTALLRRLAEEYPKTSAAKKARQRLGLPEPEEAAAPDAATDSEVFDGNGDEGRPFEVTDENSEWPTEVAPEAAQPAPDPKSNLPRGFRPKK